MNIGEIAEQSGLPAKTIRYYEDIGLVEPARLSNGYRDFGEVELHKLAFLRRARSLGFSIEQCRNLLGLYEDRTRSSANVKRLAAEHLREIETKIGVDEFNRMAREFVYEHIGKEGGWRRRCGCRGRGGGTRGAGRDRGDEPERRCCIGMVLAVEGQSLTQRDGT